MGRNEAAILVIAILAFARNVGAGLPMRFPAARLGAQLGVDRLGGKRHMTSRYITAEAANATSAALVDIRVHDAANATSAAFVEVQHPPLSLVMAATPIRIFRGGGMAGGVGVRPEGTTPSWLHCDETNLVRSQNDMGDRCPEECPFFAQDRTDDDFCSFRCVTEAGCAEMFPEKQIGDVEMGVCRACMVEGCAVCDESVTVDRCLECQSAYVLGDDGLCTFAYMTPLYVSGAVVGVIFVFVVYWVVDMTIRPCWNEQGLKAAHEARERIKIHMPKDEFGRREQWPLLTNMCRTPQVAGVGMRLHFNFQVAVMIWATLVGLLWMAFATFIDNDLWTLGTRPFGPPRDNCILVQWGYETQHALMWTKILFLWIVYIGSLIMWFFYAIYQLRTFQDSNYQCKTMKDFVLLADGLPGISGERNVEEELKSKVEALYGTALVGVSVAWDYQEHEEQILKSLTDDVDAADPGPEPFSPPEMTGMRKWFYEKEVALLGLPDPVAEGITSDPEVDADPIERVVRGLRTSPRAFFVFETQEAMEETFEKAGDGFDFEGSRIHFMTIEAEPNTCQWVNFGHSSASEKALKVLAGFGIILLACAFWAVVFYSPYAYYVMTFNYDNGAEPGMVVATSFSMIVVVGNAIMYEVCARISDWVGFRFKDNREACYMILYTIACLFNVALDFVTTYLTAEMMLEALGFRNYQGVPLEEITDFTEKFETYGMQRFLAENTFDYAFPSTFLIPFLIEPAPTILAPLALGHLIVRSHTEAQGLAAEEFMAMIPMELGRYADILLNVILGIIIFYFPGGYTWILFLAMAASHIWIYVFDQYKVLRQIPTCIFASYDVEWWAQALMAPIIGVVVAVIVFKSNCEADNHCINGLPLIAACTLGWFVHSVAHLLVLIFVIPLFSKPPLEDDPNAGMTYEALASTVPCSWFTSNPVYCLRSKHHYKHSPPCMLYRPGKENVLKRNKAIGCFYEGSTDPK